MPAFVMLVVTLITNYVRYRRGQSTICQWVRRLLPRPVAAAGLLAFFGWFVPHLLGGYKQITQAAPTTIHEDQ